MIVLVGAISAVFAFGVVVLARLAIRFALHLMRPPEPGATAPRGFSSLFTAPEFRPDRIALAAATVLLTVLMLVYALVVMQA